MENESASTPSNDMTDMSFWQEQWAWAQEWLATNGLELLINILLAIVVFVLGRWLAKLLTGGLRRALVRAKLETALISFLCNIAYIFLLAVVIIATLNQLGVNTTSAVAVVGAAGLAVGLALQGSLSNFAAGVMIILFKPFRTDDFVEINGTLGIVEEINIFTTHLRTPDNKAVIVPNGQVTDGNITNFTAKQTRRMDMVWGVHYDADLKKAKEVFETALKEDPGVLEEPAITVGILEFADSSINFAVRPWVKTAEYWDVFFRLNEDIKRRLDEAGIVIPYPQRDVHLFQEQPPARDA